jgi:hypothetical protein
MLHFTKHCLRLGATTALVALLSTGLALPSHAAGTWKVNITKSTFSSASNTLVLDRYDTKVPATQTGAAAANAFLVVADKKIYLATNDATYGASSNSLRTVDYSRWRDMKLIELGSDVRSLDTCNFRCQSGLPDPRMTLTFKATHGNPKDQMNEIVVFNK